MQNWDRRATYFLGALLLLMGVGHGFNYPATSQNLVKSAVEGNIAEQIRVVWLTISGMLTLFGLLLMREAWGGKTTDGVLILSIGSLLTASGVTGLTVSTGNPFWLQQVIIGLAVAVIGWRAKGKVQITVPMH